MIQIDKYTKKFQIAKERRNNPKFMANLDREFASSDIQEKLSAFALSLDDISKASDFEKNEEAIKTFFNQIYEKITSPGLDAFIGWIGTQTTSQNQANIKEFKKFLKDNYDNYADSIESILSAKEIVEKIDSTSIFKKLVSNFDSKLKNIVTKFIDNKAFEHEIDGFLRTLKREYENTSEIEALSYTQISQLYTEEQQADNTIEFYYDIFGVLLKKHQSLDTSKGEDKNTEYFTRVNNRISSIRKCIGILSDSKIAQNSDETIKSLFLKFQKEMPIVEDDYLQSLKEFVNKEWDQLSFKYEEIKAFYSTQPLQFKNNDYSGLKKGGEITNLITSYLQIVSDGPLSISSSASTTEIKSLLNKKSKTINDLSKDSTRVKSIIKEEFDEYIDKYAKQKSMLSKSIEAYESLKEDFDIIYGEDGNLDNLKNGISEYLSEESDLLEALSNDGIKQMIELMNSTTVKFEDTLKQTGLSEPIDWLDGLTDSTNIAVENLDADKIRLLLSRGLITLSINRTYK